MKKIISGILAAILFCTMFAACGGSESDSGSAKVTVSIEADGEKILNSYEVTVEGIDGEAPVALDAIIMALEDNEIPFETGMLASAPKIDKIQDYDTGVDNEYIWELFINGDEAKGRMHACEIKDGDKLELIRNDGVGATATSEVTTEEITTAPPVQTVDDGFEG